MTLYSWPFEIQNNSLRRNVIPSQAIPIRGFCFIVLAYTYIPHTHRDKWSHYVVGGADSKWTWFYEWSLFYRGRNIIETGWMLQIEKEEYKLQRLMRRNEEALMRAIYDDDIAYTTMR